MEELLKLQEEIVKKDNEIIKNYQLIVENSNKLIELHRTIIKEMFEITNPYIPQDISNQIKEELSKIDINL